MKQIEGDFQLAQDLQQKELIKAQSKKVVEDRKSTRLNSSHLVISYAVFCLKKKTNNTEHKEV